MLDPFATLGLPRAFDDRIDTGTRRRVVDDVERRGRHCESAGGELPRAQAGAGLVGESHDFRAQLRVISDVSVEGLLGTDLLLIDIRHHRPVVDAFRKRFEHRRHPAHQQVQQIRQNLRGKVVIKVTRNTLIKHAFEEIGGEIRDLSKYVSGHSAIIFTNDKA